MFDVVIPVWGMGASNDQTMKQEVALANATPIPSGAVAVWDAYWLEKLKDRGEWYASLRVPAGRNGGALA